MGSSRCVMKYQDDKRWPRYTPDEWHKHNRQEYCMTVNRGMKAEKLIEQTERVRARVQETILKKKEETELLFRGRIEDVDFLRVELENVRNLIQVELEALDILQERIQDEIKCVRRNSEEIVLKCIQFRENRLGIDLIRDEVDRELEIERKKISEAGTELDKIMEQTKEFKRDLRASIYLLNQDVKDKLRCLAIEIECLNLKESDKNLRIHEENDYHDKSKTTVEEWTYFSQETMRKAEKKIQAARLFQARINILLKEIISDLMEQKIRVDETLKGRIEEIKEAKGKLEEQHQEITRQVNQLKQNISESTESIKEKEKYLALARSRLEIRSNRPETELVRDRVGISLVEEISEVKNSVATLLQLLSEGKKTLRHLLECQMQLEEEINVKINSIKIDEVDCLTIRNNINYHFF